MSADRFDPFDPRCIPDIYEHDASMRAEQPVSRPLDGFAYLVRYDHVRDVLRDVRTFKSAGGMRAPGVEIAPDEILFNEMDPPLHPRMRRLLIEAFHRSVLEQLEPFAAELARERVDAAARSLRSEGKVDLVAALTVPVPNVVTVRLLGFPAADADWVAACAHEVMHSDWPPYNRRHRDGEAVGLDGFPEFRDYIDSHIAERRAGRGEGNDLVTRLTRVEVDGERLNDLQIRTAVAFMFFAGISTATNLLGNMLYELGRRPQAYARLRAQPELVPAAIEESLRYRPPVTYLTRTATSDCEFGGELVRAGERVIVSIASSGRDEAVWGEDSDRFSLDRGEELPHLAFGPGAHYCVGRNLARIEARAVLSALLDRFQRLELAPGFEFDNIPVPFEWGPRSVEAVGAEQVIAP